LSDSVTLPYNTPFPVFQPFPRTDSAKPLSSQDGKKRISFWKGEENWEDGLSALDGHTLTTVPT
jgi:hypothetical protein